MCSLPALCEGAFLEAKYALCVALRGLFRQQSFYTSWIVILCQLQRHSALFIVVVLCRDLFGCPSVFYVVICLKLYFKGWFCGATLLRCTAASAG